MCRLAMLCALAIASGCGPGDAPKPAPDGSLAAAPKSEGVAGVQREARIPRVAILLFLSKDAAPSAATAPAAMLVRKRLAELGYVDGTSIRFEEHYADGDLDRLARLAQEVAATKPDVIVAIAAAAAAAARRATDTIPIVMAHAGNPEASGLVASLAKPGGNVTGTTSMVPDLATKQIEILRELLPGIRTLGVLANPTNPSAPALLATLRDEARARGITVTVGEVTGNADFDAAFRKLRDARPHAMLVMVEPLIGMNRSRVIDFAAAHRIPTSFDVGREFVRNGGLISYGPVLSTHYAIVAEYVDRILKGAEPRDLPVHQPTELALVINLGTAKALGLTIPQALLLRADEVIQ